MTKKSKFSASSLLLSVSFLALIGSLFIIAVVSEHAPVFAAMKEKGRAAEATVTGKEIRVKEGTTRKGRKTQLSSHFLHVSYDGASDTPHAEAAAGQPIRPSAHPTVISADIQVSEAEYENSPIGATTRVTWLPDKMFEPKLSAAVTDYTPVWQITTAVLLFLLAVVTALMAWKRRTPRGL